VAFGSPSHAEGGFTTAIGQYSHSEGYLTEAGEAVSINIASNTYDGVSFMGNTGSFSYYQAVFGLSFAPGNPIIIFDSNDDVTYTATLTNVSGQYDITFSGSGFPTSATVTQGTITFPTVYTIGAHAEGYQSTASGNYSHVEGYNSLASGDYSHAEGYSNVASGQYSHVEGSNSVASGYCSHAEGNNAQANGEYSHAEGNGTRANGESSHVAGENALANNNNTYVWSARTTYSDNGASTFNVHASGGIYLQGGSLNVSGTISSSTNAMTLTSASTASGTTANAGAINITSASSGGNIVISSAYTGTGTTTGAICFIGNDVPSSSSNAAFTFITISGTSYINSSSGAFVNPSDLKLKKNIEECTLGIDFISKIEPKTYHTVSQPDDDLKIHGFVAQQIEKVCIEHNLNPQSIVIKPQSEDDSYHLDYTQFIAPMVKAIQEQQRMIGEQQRMIGEQNSMILQMRTELDQLKKDRMSE